MNTDGCLGEISVLTQSEQSHIRVLPSELLLEVFLWVEDLSFADITEAVDQFEPRIEGPPPSSAWNAGPPPCWYLSHVCQLWRQLAIGCSTLWAHLPRHSSDWTEVCLERSRTAPVHLHFEAWFEDALYDYAQRHAATCIPRARTISACLVRNGDASRDQTISMIIQALAHFAAPNICVLELEYRNDIPNDPEPYPAELPDVLTHGQTPTQLHTVRLEGFLCRSTDAILSSSITSLTLAHSSIWRNVDEMAELFRSMILLEHFSYVNTGDLIVGFDTAFSPRLPQRSISLPNLKNFSVQADIQKATTIFAHLNLCSDCGVTISYHYHSESPLPDERVYDIANYIAVGGAAAQAHFASAADRGFSYARVAIYLNLLTGFLSDDEDADLGACMQLPYYVRENGERITSAPTYLQIPVICRTTTLRIDKMLAGFMVSDLMCFGDIRSLELSEEAAAVFWGALTGNSVNLSQSSVTPCRPFPALERVRIIRFNFVNWPGSCVDETDIPSDFARLLAGAIRKAYLALGTFEYVSFEGCTIEEGDVEVFRSTLGYDHVRLESHTGP
ncbi:hypothetical protein PENSPDRAFT_142613 [Peniophora sp. CONT]|nr:hypothetical protein PENSPDRAFT_142613 [Peniophora sp. CONT]